MDASAMHIPSTDPAYPLSWHATTILTIRKNGRVVIAGDGQVSLGATIIKANAKKVRTLGKTGYVIGGFAGASFIIPAGKGPARKASQVKAFARHALDPAP
jgi:hypothetical protein